MYIRVRHCKYNPDDRVIFQVLGKDEVANSTYQDAWDTEMAEQTVSGMDKSALQVYLQYLPQHGHGQDSKEILRAEFPDLRCSYSFQSIRGVAQWYFVPLRGWNPKDHLPRGMKRQRHNFFSTVLVPITTSMFNGIGALLSLRNNAPICVSCEPTTHKHYLLKVLMNFMGNSPCKPSHTISTHTMHLVCGMVSFSWFIFVLSGCMAEESVSLTLETGENKRYNHGASPRLMNVSDIRWPGAGEAISLRPFPNTVSSLG